MLVDFVCIKFFLSVDGISFDFGFIIFNMMEVYLNVKMIKVVFQVVIFVDFGKFGKKGFGKICDIEVVYIIIMDGGLLDVAWWAMEDKGVKVFIV